MCVSWSKWTPKGWIISDQIAITGVSEWPDDRWQKRVYKRRSYWKKPLILPERMNVQSELQATGLGRLLQNYRLLLLVILERMLELWRQMDQVSISVN